MESKILLWKTIRSQILNFYYKHELDYLFKTPPGLSNNLIWIFGHLVRSRDFLLLKISGKNMNFPSHLDPYFAKGSSPSNWAIVDNQVQFSENLKISKEELFKELLQFEEKEFSFLLQYIESEKDFVFPEPYQTSLGYLIDNLQKAFDYNLTHESLHLGHIQIYNKLIDFK